MPEAWPNQAGLGKRWLIKSRILVANAASDFSTKNGGIVMAALRKHGARQE
jgi:hypothetical protein